MSQDQFARAMGFAKRTVGNAERGVHPPSLPLRRALDQALEQASESQRDRFFVALAVASVNGDTSVARSGTTLQRVALGPDQSVALIKSVIER